ncbi:MAG: bifunctional diaminohydroxyphosphoribosylaminopyrimidine deaminase/5-amino-6-(5-phosphoribosylamino)uracil reductase RibD [Deltaproteobacteria bacterium]|jgi:diaminohydroxyphosphoribosylaminopyrimidine deaminase/5-amino-6-(5-phosphoribosylamino)uracil reductase|nr:bifunctional diaminohydroxyphosphoribosylaminopyrimidine deaminase/5-amino-6-(5-phosphoribosylamino)uracil reductase RibD [Deltaproteobacteria bacterium]
MDAAIALAEQGRWHACPNPVVGAVLVRDGHIAAQGFHSAYGQPHAEAQCLRNAAEQGVDPADCTLCVTLEPCRHYGKTPPCTQAIVQAGIRRVVVGLLDPNPQAGGGAEWLRAQGVEVHTGIREQACRDVTADFLVWRQEQRPYLILKLASTLDGRIATRNGHAQWISGDASRASVHELRAHIGGCGGAVLIGGNTLYADNPLLTARPFPAGTRQPLACILTSRLPKPADKLHLLRERPDQCVFLCSRELAASPDAEALRDIGTRVHGLDAAQTHKGLDLHAGLRLLLHDYACFYVLCEGGGRLALSLLEQGLADEVRLHMAARILGDNAALPLFDGRVPLRMDESLDLRICSLSMCGEDAHIVLRPR